MAEVFASLGSNLNREHNIRSAVRALVSRFGSLKFSPVYLSKTVGFEGDDFLNLVVGFSSELSPEAIHQQFRQIEDEHGRERGQQKFSSRQLDIDLILYDDLVQTNGSLILPRKDIEQYAFVLKPLADLEPDGMHPVLHKTYAQMWCEYKGDRQLTVIDLQFTD